MRSAWLAVGMVAAVSVVTAAEAEDGAALTKSAGCLNCHAIDQKKMAPSFKDIAAKYAGTAGAEATLMAELKEGKGHPKISATDGELKAMIDYVLSAH